MKFFLMILIFTPWVFAEEGLVLNANLSQAVGDKGVDHIMEAAEEVMARKAQAVRYVMEEAEEVSAQRARAVRDAMEEAEKISAQRARAVRDAVADAEERVQAMIIKEKIDMDPKLELLVIDAIPNLRLIDVNPELRRIDVTPALKIRPEAGRIDLTPEIQWIKPSSQSALMEMYHDISVMGTHLSGLIASSDGAFCELSQDPLQCCNTFAQNPNQCLVEKIEKGLLYPSALTKGVCDVAQNMEQCASQARSSVLLQLATQQGGDVEQVKAMDYKLTEVLKSDRERAKSGVRFPLPLACVKDMQSSECMEILEKITSGLTHNFSAGDDSSPGLSMMDYPYPMEALSSPLPLELSDYDMAVLRTLYSRQVGAACKDDPNSKRCVTLMEAMALHGKSPGMRHNFSASGESSPDVAEEIFSGEQTSISSMMDYGTLQLHQLGKVMGLPHYELNEADIEKLRELYKDAEAPSSFP